MDVLLKSVLPFAVMLVFLVVVHELGHFFTAKAFGIKVLEFGIGYPPRAFGFKRGETEYTFNWLPLGGFVRLLGEEDPSDPRSLAAQAAWKRILVLVAGAVMNVVLPVLLFAVAFMIPQDYPVGGARVVEVQPDSPAARAGIQSGDVILSINGRTVESTNDAARFVRLYQGSTQRWVVRRPVSNEAGRTVGNDRIQVDVYSRWTYPSGQGPTGISLFPLITLTPRRPAQTARDYIATLPPRQPGETDAAYEQRVPAPLPAESADDYVKRLPPRQPGESDAAFAARVPPVRPAETDEEFATRVRDALRAQPMETRTYAPWEAFPKGVRETAETLILTRNQAVQWFKERSAPAVSGPVGIAQATGQVVEQAGWKALLQLAALLSINLAVINLLPLPMLDGGRVFFILIEVLRGGKRVPPEKEALVHIAGFVVLISLAVVVSFIDIQRIVNGESPFR